MKLRTELLRGPDGVTITAGSSEGQYSAREHDALAAHALLQALGEYGFPGATKMITERAESILASWGVEQEVAG